MQQIILVGVQTQEISDHRYEMQMNELQELV